MLFPATDELDLIRRHTTMYIPRTGKQRHAGYAAPRMHPRPREIRRTTCFAGDTSDKTNNKRIQNKSSRARKDPRFQGSSASIVDVVVSLITRSSRLSHIHCVWFWGFILCAVSCHVIAGMAWHGMVCARGSSSVHSTVCNETSAGGPRKGSSRLRQAMQI